MVFNVGIEEPIVDNKEVYTYDESSNALVLGAKFNLPLNRYSFVLPSGQPPAINEIAALFGMLISHNNLHAVWIESWTNYSGTMTPARSRLRLANIRKEGFNVVKKGDLVVAVKTFMVPCLFECSAELERFTRGMNFIAFSQEQRVDVLSADFEKTLSVLPNHQVYPTDSILRWLASEKKSMAYLQPGSDMGRTGVIIVGWHHLSECFSTSSSVISRRFVASDAERVWRDRS